MGVTFLHAADLHLGSQLKTGHRGTDQLTDVLDSAVYTATERLFDIAIEADVDFVILAGDLYDEDSRSVKANTFLQAQFERLEAEAIPVYIAYGNHDPVRNAITYVDLPDNVYEFDADAPEEFVYPDQETPHARIWGQSYRDRHESRSMYHRFTPADERVPNIGVLHTGLNPDGRRYVPVSRRDLESKSEIHYWALGHIHAARMYETAQPVAFPGVPQGRQISEEGIGGGYLVEVDATGEYEIEFIPTSPIVWQTFDVDVSGESISTLPDIQRQIGQAVDELPVTLHQFDQSAVTVRDVKWGVDGYVCRWRLIGNGPIHETLSSDDEAVHELTRRLQERFTARNPFIWTEAVRNETGPPVPPIEELRGSDRVIDEFLDLRGDIQEGEAIDQFRDVVGDVWEPTDDHEAGQPDELPLTDERLAELIDRASDRVYERLALRRVD